MSDTSDPSLGPEPAAFAQAAHDLRGPSGVLLGALFELELALGADAGAHARLFALARRSVERVLGVAETLQQLGDAQRAQVRPELSAASPARGELLSVLVVDDDEDTAALLALVFEREGWSVKAVGTVAAAREALARDAPSALVSDQLLPDGDGASLLELSRPRTLLAAVLLTGLREGGAGPGRFDHIVHKPAEPTHLAALLRELASRASAP